MSKFIKISYGKSVLTNFLVYIYIYIYIYINCLNHCLYASSWHCSYVLTAKTEFCSINTKIAGILNLVKGVQELIYTASLQGCLCNVMVFNFF